MAEKRPDLESPAQTTAVQLTDEGPVFSIELPVRTIENVKQALTPTSEPAEPATSNSAQEPQLSLDEVQEILNKLGDQALSIQNLRRHKKKSNTKSK